MSSAQLPASLLRGHTMKSIAKALVIASVLSAGAAHAGILADAMARHQAKKAEKAAAAASAAVPAASLETPNQAGQAAQAAAVIEYAQRTHAAAQTVVNRQLSNGEKCAELVHRGMLPPSTLSQYRCILLGPQVALASAHGASGSVSAK